MRASSYSAASMRPSCGSAKPAATSGKVSPMNRIEESAGRETSGRNAETADAARPLFISYASQDGVVAEKICAALEAAGLRCWLAPRDVRVGEPYAAAI